ncbi:MAG TPA: MarR family transcriptional regulator, partial [Bacilli bacterium]|nr:MarR family transcriptional regulator [Bacilli bacterium]
MDKQLLLQMIGRYESASFTVNRIMNAMVRERMPDNLTADQHYILRYIRDRKRCTPSELADFFFVGKSSITAIV